MSENLRELSENLAKINNNLATLLLTLNSTENIKFGNHKIKSVEVNRDKHRAILNVEGISLKEAENAIGEKGTLYIGDFIFENSFITSYVYNFGETKFTLATNNILYKNNNKKSFNIAIWNKPQQLNRLDSYINDNVNVALLCFKLYEINFTLISKNDRLFLVADRELEENKFLKYERGIKLALGFLMCDFIGGPDIFLLTDKKITNIENFKIFDLTSEQNLNFNIMIDSLPVVGDKYQNEHGLPIRLSNEQFVNLCRLIIEQSQVETAIYYIAQSGNLCIEHKLTFLAVALEALTGYVGDNITKERIQVTDSTISINKLLPTKEFKELEKVYIQMLDNYKLNSDRDEQENDNIKAVLKGKFQNRKSNRDSLSQPFKLYNIELSQNDISMLEKRNHLLHGEPFEYSDNIQEDMQTFQTQVNIYYHLLYILLLKIIGYEGIVFNLKMWPQILRFNNASFGTKENNGNIDNFFLEL